MKYVLLAIAISICGYSCTDGILIPHLEPDRVLEDQGYLTVTVIENASADSRGGCTPDGDFVLGVQGAMLTLEYFEEERPIPRDIDLLAYTDATGRYLFEGLPSGKYILDIVSRVGSRQYHIEVLLGEVTKVHARF